jgi:UDP-N-acetylmuramoylalanine--D-glutamate ligase
MDTAEGRRHNLTGVRALVVGLAREGTALARFLAEQGARVTITDVKPAEALAESRAALTDLPVSYALGGHPLALLDDVDILFVSPGVPLDIPFLGEARRRGLPLSSETRLFTRLCPAPVIGITGSSGKTTTTVLVGETLRAAGRRAWVGGNIGQPLLGHLGDVDPADAVVMELSSFQLEFFGPWTGQETGGRKGNLAEMLFDPSGWSPPTATILNITPNHLDRHSTMEAYIRAKAHILDYQRSGDTAVLNLDNAATREMGALTKRGGQRTLWFSLQRGVDEGAFLQDDELILRLEGHDQPICRAGELHLMGRHNVANTLAAFATAGAAGAPAEALRQVATAFDGVEHRLELVRVRGNVRWYNDSIATSPERTVAALQAIDAPIILLAGGRDKHLPWEEMATLTWQRVRHLILFGEAAGLIAQTMAQVRGTLPNAEPNACHIHDAGTLERAVEQAGRLAQPGDVVLLSPGGTSFDAYRNFEERGRHFRRLVEALE